MVRSIAQTAWSLPLTKNGKSALVPPGPWIYGFTGIGAYYRADVEKLRDVVPKPLEIDGGYVFAYIIEIISVNENDPNYILELPDAAQYHEAAFFVKVRYGGNSYAYCPFMYVDTDLSMLRGLLVGFPKKFAKISYTKIHPLIHGEPRNGLKLVGYASRSFYRLLKISITLNGGKVNKIPLEDMGPILLPRYFPAITPELTNVKELIVLEPEIKTIAWTGSAKIEISSGYNDILDPLKPIENNIKGYYFHLYLRPKALHVLTKEFEF